jgi:hypothetical protein
LRIAARVLLTRLTYGDYHDQPTAPTVVRNGVGLAAMITGILGLFALRVGWGVFAPVGIVAIILGFVGLGRVKRGQANNGGMATAGVILGALTIVLTVAFVVRVSKEGDLPQLWDCVSNARGDKVKQDQCTRDFRQRTADDPGTRTHPRLRQ